MGNLVTQRWLTESYWNARVEGDRPDERREREADQVADAVLSSAPEARVPPTPDWISASPGPGLPHRRGAGFPLPIGERRFFETMLGTDLRDVRMYTDSEAAQAARAFGARAFTYGNGIAFATGQFDSATHAGRRLIAHELVHVIQQRSWGTARVQMQRASRASEAEPERSVQQGSRPETALGETPPARGATFADLTSREPYVAMLAEQLSASYRGFMREIDPVLRRAGVYDRAAVENFLQREARQRVFAYENEIARGGLYDAVHLSIWIEHVTVALQHLGPLLDMLRTTGQASQAGDADGTRRDLIGMARELTSTPFIRGGVAAREREQQMAEAQQRTTSAVEHIRPYLRRVWHRDLSDAESRLHGVALAEHLVLRMRLSAEEIREVLDSLRDEDPEFLHAALLRGGTVRALLAMGIGGLQAYRAAGEGFFAGATRAERESLLARPAGQRVFSLGERLIAVGGFVAGAFQGIGDSIISNLKGVVELFTPTFWRGLVDFFRNFLPRFIDNEDFRFQLGQMVGEFSAEEERRLATAEPFEYGRTFGQIFGMALTEVVLTFVGLGFILKALNGSARLQRAARPLVVIAEAIGRTAIAARGLRVAQAIGEAINALSRRLRRLTMLLPDLTPNARLRRTLFEMEEAERRMHDTVRRTQELERLAREALAAR